MKIQKADPGARRKSLLFVGFVGIVLLALLVAGPLLGFDARDRLEAVAALILAAPRTGVIATAIGVAPIVLFAIYLFVIGARVIRAERFPLPGQAVVRDTPIREGRAAIFRGRVLQVLAVLLGLTAAALPIVLARVLATLPGA